MTNYKLLEIKNTVSSNKKVLIIYTGGTLGMVYDSKIQSLVPFEFDQILDNIPELKRLELGMKILSLDEPIDSSNVSIQVWKDLCLIIQEYYEEYDGFVILHGTDTMSYSASALSFMIQNLKKPIVFTGAQLPIGIPRTDARENLISAVEIAGSVIGDKAIVPEVSLYFNGRLIRGNRSKKQESSQFDAFDSENFPLLANIGVMVEYNFNLIRTFDPNSPTVFSTELCESVGILKLFPGISKSYINHFLNQAGLLGVVLETYGSGNAPSENWFIEEIETAINKGITIINVSQCNGGKVMMGKYETSRKLYDLGVVSGSSMTSEAAITKLMYVLAQGYDSDNIKYFLEKDLAGELV